MRIYLEELRSEKGLTTAEINKRLYALTGIRYKCRSIESGYCWPEITLEKAKILADAYQTTTDTIISLDQAEGKFEGRKYRCESTQLSESATNACYLTEEEKALAEKLNEWTLKVIRYMQFERFEYYIRSGIISFEDIEELGYAGLLQGIKDLSKHKKADQAFFSTFDALSTEKYDKWFLRLQIYSRVNAEISKMKAEKRRSYTYAKRLDGGISDGLDPEDDTNLYETIAQKEISVERQVESSYLLDMLFSHLNEHQVYICNLLMNGYEKHALIRTKIATARDIGVITFYLNQLIRFGRIKWDTSDYVSGSENVSFDFTHNRWLVTMQYKKKHYALASYADLNMALDLQVEANALRESDEFEPWYNRHMLYNEKIGRIAFTYPIPADEDEYSELCNKIANQKKTRGVRYIKRDKTYQAKFRSYYLGRTKTLEEGIALRESAEEAWNSGNFEEWYGDLRQKRILEANTNSKFIGREKQKIQWSYAIVDFFALENNCYRVICYDAMDSAHLILATQDIDIAYEVMDLANSHIEAGDYDVWLEKFISEKTSQAM